MTTTSAAQQAPAAAAPAPGSAPPAGTGPAGQQPDGEPARDVMGLVLDVAGVAAAGVLVMILIDVWTEGRHGPLAWWRRNRAARQSAAGAGDDAES